MIPVNTPRLAPNAARYLAECVETGWVSSEGPFVERFEEAMARQVNRASGVAVSNGSAALDVAVAALEIGPGDEVILPTFTIISCAAAVVRAGATPVVVDCDAETCNTTADRIAARITPRTRAIMVVHLYGLPVDMDPVLELARRHGLAIIEDAAEMHGQTYKGRPCGSFGDISTFSFYPNKLITTGEGGMVVADDPALVARARSLRNLCFDNSRRFVHEELGWNFRMTNMQAALGLAQLEEIDAFVARKREIGARYDAGLDGVDAFERPIRRTAYAENIYWVYGLTPRPGSGLERAAMMAGLGERRIGTRPFFHPMHLQPVFRRQGLFEGEEHPAAERLGRDGFYIPSGLGLTDDEIDTVCAALREIADG